MLDPIFEWLGRMFSAFGAWIKAGILALIVMALDRNVIAERGSREIIGAIRRDVEAAIAGTGATSGGSATPPLNARTRT